MFRLEDPHSTVDYNRPDAPNQNQTFPSNRLIMFHTSLESLIANAYGIRSFQYILGGPDWHNSQHYDLSAKVEGDARLTREEMRPMLQTLLNIVEFGMSPQEAVEAPRFQSSHFYNSFGFHEFTAGKAK